MTRTRRSLRGRIAVVAGATRGAGRGIAHMLGEAGAIVYCTGRTTRAVARRRRARPGDPFVLAHRRETIEDSAALVTAAGGHGIAVRVDHSDPRQVRNLFAKVAREHGRLDVLVNDIWGGDELAQWGLSFWQQGLDKGFAMIERAVKTHIITARYGVPLMLHGRRRRGGARGLVVEITDGDRLTYRGAFFYDLVKATVMRSAFAMAEELRPHHVAAVALTPGFLRSEAMLDHFGVTEDSWRDGTNRDPHFAASETPCFVGRAVAALAADPQIMVRSGRVLSSWRLARAYGFRDIDGSRPDWGRYLAAAPRGSELARIRRDAEASHSRFLAGFGAPGGRPARR